MLDLVSINPVLAKEQRELANGSLHVKMPTGTSSPLEKVLHLGWAYGGEGGCCNCKQHLLAGKVGARDSESL